MRIDAFNAVSQVYGTNAKLKAQATGKTEKATDKVEISQAGKDIQIAKKAVKDAPDIREDKVAEIKAAIKNGTYKVSDESFAEKLLKAYDSVID